MAETMDSPSNRQPLERSFADRRPLTAAFLVVEALLAVLAGILFVLGDPMAPKADTASVVGGLVAMVALMLAVIGVLVYTGTFVIKLYASRE